MTLTVAIPSARKKIWTSSFTTFSKRKRTRRKAFAEDPVETLVHILMMQGFRSTLISPNRHFWDIIWYYLYMSFLGLVREVRLSLSLSLFLWCQPSFTGKYNAAQQIACAPMLQVAQKTAHLPELVEEFLRVSNADCAGHQFLICSVVKDS